MPQITTAAFATAHRPKHNAGTDLLSRGTQDLLKARDSTVEAGHAALRWRQAKRGLQLLADAEHDVAR